MTGRLLFIVSAAVLLFSCENVDSVEQTCQYNERSSGDFSLDPVRAVVVRNHAGPVIIEGNSNSSRIGWFLDKWVTAESQTMADELLPQTRLQMEIVNDTANLSVLAPSIAFNPSALVSLTLPNNIPCILDGISGTNNVSYLHSSLAGKGVGNTTIVGHFGNCEIAGRGGDISVELSLPDSGHCIVEAHSGNVTLRIPVTTSSMIAARTEDGTIQYTNLVILDSMRTTNAFIGRLGMGRGTIQLSTGRGNILITGF